MRLLGILAIVSTSFVAPPASAEFVIQYDTGQTQVTQAQQKDGLETIVTQHAFAVDTNTSEFFVCVTRYVQAFNNTTQEIVRSDISSSCKRKGRVFGSNGNYQMLATAGSANMWAYGQQQGTGIVWSSDKTTRNARACVWVGVDRAPACTETIIQ